MFFDMDKQGFKIKLKNTFYTDLCPKSSNVEIRPLKAAAIFILRRAQASVHEESGTPSQQSLNINYGKRVL